MQARIVKKISELLPDLAGQDAVVSGIQIDSRRVAKGDLFIAVPGLTTDGRKFISAALHAGAAAVLYEAAAGRYEEDGGQIPQSSVPILAVAGLGARIGPIASSFFDHPSRDMRIVAVTGTNGKTSCCHYIAGTLSTLGDDCGIVGTLGWGRQDSLTPLSMTTPDAPDLQAIFHSLKQQSISSVAIEASSHGLAQGRLQGVSIDTAVFTNLTRDHLDYHEDLKDYQAAKRKLFEMESLSVAVVNIDDAYGRQLHQQLNHGLQKLSYSMTDAVADVYCEHASFETTGMKAEVRSPWGKGTLDSSLYGQFNLQNLLAVVCVLGAEEKDFKRILEAISALTNVKGRMERIESDRFATVVIDYAHTPDALMNALQSVKNHCAGELWCVFGCGGDRDRGKRHQMGRIAERLADWIVITDDNPRSEPSADIASDILKGISDASKAQVIQDRSQAIRYALANASSRDLVLIAGKGHEDYQVIGTQSVYFSDHDQVGQILAASRS